MGSRTRFAVAMGLLQCVAVCVAPAASAQAPDKADAAAARKEGNLSWYTSTPVALAQQLADKFQEQTGIKVQLLRTGGQAVLRRLQRSIHWCSERRTTKRCALLAIKGLGSVWKEFIHHSLDRNGCKARLIASSASFFMA